MLLTLPGNFPILSIILWVERVAYVKELQENVDILGQSVMGGLTDIFHTYHAILIIKLLPSVDYKHFLYITSDY